MHDIAGTIAVTGAEGQVGRALREHLHDLIRCAPGGAAPAAVRVVPRPLEGPLARAVLERADAVVHLAGALRPDPGESLAAANLASTRAVADAVRGDLSKRVLYLSYVGASEASSNAYLRAKAAAERALFDSGARVVVFRCTHIIGPPDSPGPTARALLAGDDRRVTVLGDGRQRIAPVYRDDVVAALSAALTAGAPGVYDLAGPDRMTLDDLVRILNRDPGVLIRHLSPIVARALGLFHPDLNPALVDLMLRDGAADPARAVSTFGLTLTSIRSVWGLPEIPREGRAERALQGAA